MFALICNRIIFVNKKMTHQIELKVPEDMLTMESMKKFKPFERYNYFKRLILIILNMNKKRRIGITAGEIAEVVEFSSSQINRALKELSQLREIYYIEHRKRKLYYVNGKVEHKIIGDEFVAGDKLYIFKLIANSRRKMELFIQEKSVNLFGEQKNAGNIIIPIKFLDEFIANLEFLKLNTEELSDMDVIQ